MCSVWALGTAVPPLISPHVKNTQRHSSLTLTVSQCIPMPQGDVVLCLSDTASHELGGGADRLSKPRLQSLLEMTVRTSSLAQVGHSPAWQHDYY